MAGIGRRTRHRGLAILWLSVAAIALVACGASTPPATPNAAAPTTAPAAPTTAPAAAVTAAPVEQSAELSGEITVMNWNISAATDKVFQDQALEFEKSHPNTKVNMTLLPFDQYNQKLTLLMSSGQAPDIAGMPGDVMAFAEQGKIIPLDEYIQLSPELEDPAQTRVEAHNMVRFKDGHIYASQSGSLCSMQLYYNQELFDKAGVKYPDDTWTWDDFVAAAKQLTIQDGGETTQWGADLGYMLGWDGGWQAEAAAFGANIMDTNFNPKQVHLDDPAVIAAWQFIQDLVYKDKVAPTPAARDALGSAGGPFQSGKVAMVPDGCWMLSSYKESIPKLGMAVLPKGKAARVHPIWYANAYVITSDSKNKALAWEFLKWLAVDQKANEMMASAGLNCGAPLLKKYDDLYSAAWKGVPGGDACVKSLDTAKFFQIFSSNWTEINDKVITPEWDKFTNGTISAADLSTAINGKVNEMLK